MISKLKYIIWGAGMKIYTGRGDFGNTNLIGGQTVKKTDPRVEAYGSMDELNAHIGLLISFIDEEHESLLEDVKADMLSIQHDLFDIGSILADKDNKLNLKFDISKIKSIECEIDALTKKLSKIEYFILPGGTKQAAQAHIVRTVMRRVERNLLRFSEKESVDKNILIYLNRLSDYFFTVARYLNKQSDREENVYTKTGKVFHKD